MIGERNLTGCGNMSYGDRRISDQEYIEIVADLISGQFQPIDVIFKYSSVDYTLFDDLIATFDKLYEEFGAEELICLRAKIIFSELTLLEYNFQAEKVDHSLEDLDIIAKIDHYFENHA